MEWYREVQFVAAGIMPVEWAREYGTTVNGMWVYDSYAPAHWEKATIQQAHAEGRRVQLAVPLIALTYHIYEKEEHRYLLDEVCRDIDGNEAEVKWYYWDSKPVYAMCVYSRVFLDYLLSDIKTAIEAGADSINVDEIQTNIGLMSRDSKDPGFCPRCLEKFCAELDSDAPLRRAAGIENVREFRRDDYSTLLRRLRQEDALYDLYVSVHNRLAFRTAAEFFSEIRCAIAAADSEMAVTANLTGLGTFLESNGQLWGASWGELIDYAMMENVYVVDPTAFQSGPGHQLLPRGKFTSWYRLASALGGKAPAWLAPQIFVPRQLAGRKCVNYYLLMFLESYANNGRWGYYMYPGVDDKTRLEATVPELVKDYTRFILEHRQYYEGGTTENTIAILYADSAVLANPKGHHKYIALAQALAESGFQYDVLYAGDDNFIPGDIAPETLARYRAVLLPEAGTLTASQAAALKAYAKHGGRVIVYSASRLGRSAGITTVRGNRLLDFWTHYRPRDRERIVAPLLDAVEGRIEASDPFVNVVRYRKGDEHVCHVLNYDYREADDTIAPKTNVEIAVAWPSEALPSVRWLTLGGEERLTAQLNGGRLSFSLPKLDPYGLAILKE
jgi:hypothetical protein